MIGATTRRTPLPREQSPTLISIVVPVLNEEGCVEELARRVQAAVDPLPFELIFVDDGSHDGTPAKLEALRSRESRVKFLRLTRSFGHQAALLAGIERCTGDVIVTMDGDLQHPPELLPALLDAWRGGYDVVQTLRRPADGEAAGWKARASEAFYRVMSALSGIAVAPGSADFRLLDRRAVRELLAFPEHFVFLRGMIPWMGFPTAEIPYVADPRFAGAAKYGFRRMVRLALNGLFSFSVVPLRLISILGLLTTLLGITYGVFAVAAQLSGNTQTGWTSLAILVLVFGGVQLLSLGVASEYIGRTYEEAKRRPRYVVDRSEGIDPP